MKEKTRSFPEKLTVTITDRWFGYDHFAVKECFAQDAAELPPYGAEAEYVLKSAVRLEPDYTHYVVMTNYGCYEGWKKSGETTDFQEAVKIREDAMGLGNSEVVIFKLVKLEVREAN